MMKRLKVELRHPNAKEPAYANYNDACMDIFSTEDVVLKPGKRVTIDTGVHPFIPEDYEIQIRSKSGLAHRYGVVVLNSPGTIDESYPGTLQVILYNTGEEDCPITVGQKIAQICLSPVTRTLVVNIHGRGRIGGLGSTGTHAI